MSKSLIILRGLPGSGKSTVAKLFNAPVCCADDYVYVNGEYMWTPQRAARAHMLCQDKCKTLMKEGKQVIVIANTNVKERDIRVYSKMAEQFGYIVFSLVVENRHGGKNEHGVPEEKLKDMEQNFSIKLT
jgi:predicted kinase